MIQINNIAMSIWNAGPATIIPLPLPSLSSFHRWPSVAADDNGIWEMLIDMTVGIY